MNRGSIIGVASRCLALRLSSLSSLSSLLLPLPLVLTISLYLPLSIALLADGGALYGQPLPLYAENKADTTNSGAPKDPVAPASVASAEVVEVIEKSADDGSQPFSRSVVQISTIGFRYSFRRPWELPKIRRSYGTGFIIEGKRILTNAHVVGGAQILRLQRPDQRADTEARLLFAAHDCDLALLEAKDDRFYDRALPLKIGPSPQLNRDVRVVGFPIGGKRISITRGVVSRKEINLYSHSGVDYHLTVQVDAAINPGNSGGPALQDGKVIGMAFQTIQVGENLGYLIPPVVMRRFLADVEDGRYDGYTEFGVIDMPTTQPLLRRALGIENSFSSPNTGVLVYDILPGSSAAGHLQRGDILLSINGRQITEKGDVEQDGSLRPYLEMLDNLHDGDMVQVELWRSNRLLQLQFPARITPIIDFKRRSYGIPPAYLLLGGLLFQPLDANLMRAYRSEWSRRERSEILYRYHHFIPGRIYKEKNEDVVLTRRLNDLVNAYAEDFQHRIVNSVNGVAVKNFAHFQQLIRQARMQKGREGAKIVLDFYNHPIPLVFRLAGLAQAEARILKRYGIRQEQRSKGVERQ